MKNFHIYAEGETFETPTVHTLVEPGTHFIFRNIGGQLKMAMSIPVQFA